jgi:DNA helicase-2/ATP-dependent DNA helicase PcrA
MAKLQKIPMITVHQAKGCEFNTVILAGVSERFFPSAPSKGTALEEEEKKVFYVAITRAKERLIMTRVTKDYKTGERIAASPYAFKIPAEYLNENNAW